MTDAVRRQTTEVLPTRRMARRAEAARVPPRPGRSGSDRSGRRPVWARLTLSVLVSGLTVGIVATVALPSYAFDPVATGGSASLDSGSVGAQGAAAVVVTAGPTQALAVDGGAQQAVAPRDKLTSTVPTPVQKRRAFAAKFARYSGKTAADYAADPDHLPFSLKAVFATAESYLGVPYVFGGADPSGMDCSGFVMFVYARYGISVAHSVHMEDAAGVRISEADAQPGDLVVFNDMSHIGFYAGNGRILDAPSAGRNIQERAIWSNAVHFVRFGLR